MRQWFCEGGAVPFGETGSNDIKVEERRRYDMLFRWGYGCLVVVSDLGWRVVPWCNL